MHNGPLRAAAAPPTLYLTDRRAVREQEDGPDAEAEGRHDAGVTAYAAVLRVVAKAE